MGARFYWPELGRFIQQDPIGDDINWYAYAANNPLVRIDPEGTYWDFVHQADAGQAACAAGLGSDAMRAISQAAYDVDQGSALSKLSPPHMGPLGLYARRALRRAVHLYKEGKKEQAWKVLGYGAHAIQDYYAHRVFRTTLQPFWVLGKHGLRFLGLGDADDPSHDPEAYEDSRAELLDYMTQFREQIGPSGGGGSQAQRNRECP